MQRHLSTGPALIAALLALHRHPPTPVPPPAADKAGPEGNSVRAAMAFPLLPFPKRGARRVDHDPVRAALRTHGARSS
ncbi:hypothetical protein HLH34_15595 [Gluconacetobacter azotocaptans]|uniref:Uncharacterized protein n=1 Tax=Gluconacetobacter azotocaptans TaxID=142834 RepID=A0A7W4JV03_9PROT|nr:hypothetical protein [Gluconacetobacter azotocaptans]MBB2191363.1 hypothetical protein [Gluconacetobacter azotocaptans]MBM9402508.1 hypothetical protein [Gluconacetobacter azotocaptans]